MARRKGTEKSVKARANTNVERPPPPAREKKRGGCFKRRGSGDIEKVAQATPDDPYPTPEWPEGWDEQAAADEAAFKAKSREEMFSWRTYIKKEWWWAYIILIVITVLVVLMGVYDQEIIAWLMPAATWLKDLPAGWVIPIVILFVVSFPPLFGHEIISVLCGVVFGIGIGIAIVAAGTFLGEIGNFYAFKYRAIFIRLYERCCCCFRNKAKHAEKMERKKEEEERKRKEDLTYGLNNEALEEVIKTGGFFVVFVVRLSAIPGHFSTAVFASCGMSIWIFMLAALLSLPKQLVIVYVGVAMVNAGGIKSPTQTIISDSVVAVGTLITILSMWYVMGKMRKARISIWRKRYMAKRHALGLEEKLGQVEEGSMQEVPWPVPVPATVQEQGLAM